MGSLGISSEIAHKSEVEGVGTLVVLHVEGLVVHVAVHICWLTSWQSRAWMFLMSSAMC